MKRVDVVIPCYNYGRYLRRCVESVLSQQGVEVRVLIIDDASTDATPALGASLVEEDVRVEFRRHQQNRGHIATYNEGLLEWASGDYALLLSSDDLLAEGALGRAAEILESDSSIGLVYGLALAFTGDDCPNVANAEQFESRIVGSNRFLERCYKNGNPVPTPTAIVRTSVQRAIGGYSDTLPHTADMEMWMRFALKGPIAVVGTVQALYRKHDANMSSGYYAQHIGDRQEVLRACVRVAEAGGRSYDQMDQWLLALRQRLAYEAFWEASVAIERADEERFQSCLRFAQETYPEICRTWAWRRLRVKHALGTGFSSLLQTTLVGLRLRQSSDRSDVAMPTVADVRQEGWWPEEA